MEFRKAMELIAANCASHKYCCSRADECPMLRVGYSGERYCMLESPWPDEVDRICEAAEEIAKRRGEK